MNPSEIESLHRLLQRQVKRFTAADGTRDDAGLLRVISATYDENDQNRIRHDRITQLMSDEMTEQYQELESHRQHLEELVARRTHEFLEAKQKAETAVRVKTDFLANMSHEIRTPLNGVLGIAGLLQDTPLNKEQLHWVEIIRKSGDLLLSIIDDILDISKIEAGEIVLDPQNFSLYTVVEDMTDILMHRAQEQRIELLVEFTPGLPDYYVGDILRIRQILLNLLSNALKFTKDGYVVLKIHGEDVGDKARLHFTVKDTGIGIPSNKLGHIFDKFSQAEESTTRKFGGTGLGLSICKNLIEMMGGTLGVESVFGQGSSFFFDLTLPYSDVPKQPPVKYLDIDITGRRALVVDDLPINGAILSKYLQSWGMTCELAFSAQSAQEKLAEATRNGKKYDVIFMDRLMPHMDGFQLAEIIRRNPAWSDLPLILITSSSSGEVANSDILKRGFLGFTLKPYHPQSLKNILMFVLDAATRKDYSRLITRDAVLESIAPHKRNDTATRKQFPNARVLAVDDMKVNLLLITNVLKKYGCLVDEAVNGKDAFYLFRHHDYDIIMMDCHMPETDGYEATTLIREYEKENNKPPIPIIGITADVMQENREHCLQVGMNDCLHKPINEKEIEATLTKFLLPSQ